MKWSWQIATVAGITIRVHWTMLLFLGWIAVVYLLEKGVMAAVTGLVTVVMVFTFVVLHELGHALTALQFGIPTRDITLLPIGGVARLQRIPEEPRQEFLIAIAGPAVNAVLALAFSVIIVLVHGWSGLITLPSTETPLLSIALMVNVAMGLFNLLPAFPMDGGRILRALLARRMSYVRATEVAASIGQFLAIAMGVLGLLTNGMLLFIAIFVYLGAQQEAVFAQAHSLMSGVTVREAMRKHFVCLKTDDQISSALDEFVAGNQHDFPVVDQNDRLLGMVYRNDLVKALNQEPPVETIADVMSSDFNAVPIDATLEHVFEIMNSSDCPVLAVVQQDVVAGLISLENIGEWLMIHSSGRRWATHNERQNRSSPTIQPVDPTVR